VIYLGGPRRRTGGKRSVIPKTVPVSTRMINSSTEPSPRSGEKSKCRSMKSSESPETIQRIIVTTAAPDTNAAMSLVAIGIYAPKFPRRETDPSLGRRSIRARADLGAIRFTGSLFVIDAFVRRNMRKTAGKRPQFVVTDMGRDTFGKLNCSRSKQGLQSNFSTSTAQIQLRGKSSSSKLLNRHLTFL